MSLRSHACPSDTMHIPQIPYMSLRSHACPSDPMHVSQIPCMSLRSHACPSDPMHVPQIPMHVPQIPCMSLRSHACPSDPMHVPQIPCMYLLHAYLILVTLMIPNIVCLESYRPSSPSLSTSVAIRLNPRSYSQHISECPHCFATGPETQVFLFIDPSSGHINRWLLYRHSDLLSCPHTYQLCAIHTSCCSERGKGQ